MDGEEPHEVKQMEMPSAVPGEEKPQAPVYAGDLPAGQQMAEIALGAPGGHQVDCKPAKAANIILGRVSPEGQGR